MKKTILTFLVVTALISCKNQENQEDEVVATDSTSVDSTAISKTETNSTCVVYKASGEVITKDEAAVYICLPEIINNDNSYTIAEVYDVSDSQSNKLVIHLKDSIGYDLLNSASKLEERKFSIDLTKLKGIDPKKTIGTVVYHDNYIQGSEMVTKAKNIYAVAQSNRNCNPSPPAATKSKENAAEINIPKVCGTGTIKPLE